MRILFLIRGNFHYTCELANALAASGQEVTIVAHDETQDFVGWGGDVRQDYREILNEKIALEWVHIPQATRIGTLVDSLRSAWRIASIVRKYRPNVIHIYDVGDYRLLSAIMLNKMRGASVVMTIHDAELHPGYKKRSQLRSMSAWNRRTADAVIVHGEDIKRRVLAGGVPDSKVHIIPRGPYSIYKRWETAEAAIPDSREVLFFGRVHLYKGLDYLIKCAPAVCREVPDARFVIAGAGPDWTRCRELIQNPEQFILHEERIPEAKVTEMFQRASVVVLPYIEASQSGVLFIAYALARPVIVTRVGSLPEVVDDGITGMIVPPGDPESLANAITYMLQHPEEAAAMGRNGNAKVISGDLSWDTIAARTVRLYEMLVS
jgi:glycosyltransferase involved in cell wall biosynthesis